MRARRSGTLIYIDSTSVVTLPPFLAPYIASKAAFDILAATTAYEVGRFGIDTTIIMPGPFTSGAVHFLNASHASDKAVAAEYATLDPMVARNETATSSLFKPGVNADRKAVADEVLRLIALPIGQKPIRTVVDFTEAGVQQICDVSTECQRENLTRMGFAELLTVKNKASNL